MPRMSDKPEPVKAPEPTPEVDQLSGGYDLEYVRVADPDTGDHYSTTRALARRAGARLLPNHEAVDRYGQPLPRKRNISKEF